MVLLATKQLFFLAYDSGPILLPLLTVEEQQAGLPGFLALNGSLQPHRRTLLGTTIFILRSFLALTLIELMSAFVYFCKIETESC